MYKNFLTICVSGYIFIATLLFARPCQALTMRAVGLGYGLSKANVSESAKRYNIILPDQIFGNENQYAGSKVERLAALHEAFEDKKVDIVIASRGGYGTLELLDQVNWDLLICNSKPFVGMCDTTAFSLALWTKTKIVNYTGSIIKTPFLEDPDQMLSTIENEKQQVHGDVIFSGQAEGTLLGGCLSLVCQLMGTEYQPNFEGSIILLEDIGENVGQIESKLNHLRLCGVFEKCNGVCFGQFTETKDADEVIMNFSKKYLTTKPVIYNLPYGHVPYGKTFPIGRTAKMNGNILEF